MSSAGCRHSVTKAALRILCLWALGFGASGGIVAAQSHLLGASTTTRVRGISFTFEDAQAVPLSALEDLIATRASRLSDRLPWPFRNREHEFLLDPVELQRDVVRVRTHLQAMGFPRAQVDYAASTFDPQKDVIRVRFTIRQGPPLMIQDVGFHAAEGYLASAFEGEMRERWIEFRDKTSFRTGDRFTAFRVVQIEDEVLSWLKDQSYAFATLHAVTTIDSVYGLADIDFLVDPGVPGTITEIDIEGNRRVSRRLVQRELPFKVGDAFSSRHLLQGQRELFALNLFQVAQVQVPPQERDSTVAVRVHLREARLRYLSAETGFDQNSGLWGQGRWSHRNFLGGARVLTATAELRTGFLASAPTLSHRLARTSAALTQPYLFVTDLAAVLEPYAQLERDPLLLDTGLAFGVNRREYGVNSTLIYGLLTTRTMSLQYNLARATTFSNARAADVRDAYGKGVLTLSGTLGWTDNLLNPRRGYTIQSFVEQAGGLQRWLRLKEVGLDYMKVSLEASAFIPLTQDLFIGVRMAGGRVWPGHDAEVMLYSDETEAVYNAQFTSPHENRFDPIRFYVGGKDVRGWNPGHVGPKVNRTTFVTDDEGIVYDGDRPVTQTARYEPVGGLVRGSASVELWYRLRGPWRVALFLDAGQVSSAVIEAPGCLPVAYRDRAQTQPVEVQCGLADEGRIDWGALRFGTGAGVRYETPIGFVRLDVAAKVNPDALDLQSPRNALLASQGLAEVTRNQLNRFGVHVSIGQAF